MEKVGQCDYKMMRLCIEFRENNCLYLFLYLKKVRNKMFQYIGIDIFLCVYCKYLYVMICYNSIFYMYKMVVKYLGVEIW